MWYGLIIAIIRALLAGDFKRLWAEQKAKEARNAENEANALSDRAVDDELRRWTKPE